MHLFIQKFALRSIEWQLSVIVFKYVRPFVFWALVVMVISVSGYSGSSDTIDTNCDSIPASDEIHPFFLFSVRFPVPCRINFRSSSGETEGSFRIGRDLNFPFSIASVSQGYWRVSSADYPHANLSIINSEDNNHDAQDAAIRLPN